MQTQTNLLRSAWTFAGLALTTLFGASMLSGCLVVGATSSGGAFIWPGGLGLIVILLVVFLLLRKR
jgi:hypothetical protein